MWHKIWQKINNTVMGGAILITGFSFLSKIFALLRERLIAHNFGASEISDIYYAAFRLPDLIFNTLVLGALTSAFIPVFQKAWHKDREKALILANSVLNFFLLIMAILVLLAFVFAPPLMKVLTPGFLDWQLDQVTYLTRIMLFAVFFFVASNLLGGVLNSWKKFFSFSLASSFYNIGIIIGIVWLHPIFSLAGLAWGVVLGAAMHLLVQLPEAYKHGYHYQVTLKFSQELKKILWLMLPRTFSLAVGQLNLIATTVIASSLVAGSIAVFNLANNLQSLPVSLFAVSLAIAVFPTFTQAINENNKQLFATTFSRSFRRILFLLVPLSVFILILRAQFVRIVLGSGAFNWDNTYYTAQALGCFAISIFAQGLIPLLARSFYACEDTKTPMYISLFSVAINIILSIYLAAPYGVLGLATAFSISSILNMILLYIFLHRHVPDLDDYIIFVSSVKIIFNSLLSGSTAYLALHFIAKIVDMHSFIGIFSQGLVAGTVGLLSYLILGIVFKLEEVDLFKKLFKKGLLIFKK